MKQNKQMMKEYATALGNQIRQEYHIDEENYIDYNIKRGLRKF